MDILRSSRPQGQEKFRCKDQMLLPCRSSERQNCKARLFCSEKHQLCRNSDSAALTKRRAEEDKTFLTYYCLYMHERSARITQIGSQAAFSRKTSVRYSQVNSDKCGNSNNQLSSLTKDKSSLRDKICDRMATSLPAVTAKGRKSFSKVYTYQARFVEFPLR